MIRSRLAILLAEKGHRDGQKITYEVVMANTGLSKGVLVRLNSDNVQRVDAASLDALCAYLSTPERVCGVGDILEYVPAEGAKR